MEPKNNNSSKNTMNHMAGEKEEEQTLKKGGSIEARMISEG